MISRNEATDCQRIAVDTSIGCLVIAEHDIAMSESCATSDLNLDLLLPGPPENLATCSRTEVLAIMPEQWLHVTFWLGHACIQKAGHRDHQLQKCFGVKGKYKVVQLEDQQSPKWASAGHITLELLSSCKVL